jgi:tRNA pseudouridine38-40 synthase
VTAEHVDEPAGVPEQSGPSGLVRLRLDVAYDGGGFHGWARQPGLRTVQAELEAALRAALRVPAEVPVRVAVAGRTDAGVHATGQVCHADVPALPTAAPSSDPQSGGGDPHVQVAPSRSGGVQGLCRRVNGLLAPDVRVRRVTLAPPGFDARWSAAWRRYRYLVADDPARHDPRTRGHVLWHPRPLDVPAMAAAAAPFVGEHDFAAFCRAREGASSVRTVQAIGWHRGDDGVVAFEVRADAFCHAMVRSLVGAFLAVGEGRWPAQRPADLLAAAARVPGITTAPAHGLTLVEVGYPSDADLAAQALRARRWRGR